jgi:hypothetical protein
MFGAVKPEMITEAGKRIEAVVNQDCTATSTTQKHLSYSIGAPNSCSTAWGASSSYSKPSGSSSGLSESSNRSKPVVKREPYEVEMYTSTGVSRRQELQSPERNLLQRFPQPSHST